MNYPRIALRPQEAAELTGLSIQRLAKLRVTGGGPRFSRAGRSILYRPEDLHEWLERNARGTTSETKQT